MPCERPPTPPPRRAPSLARRYPVRVIDSPRPTHRAATPAAEAPPVTRRRALGALGLGAGAVCALAACGPEDQGFGNVEPLAASGDEIALDQVPENATTIVNFGSDHPFVAIVRGRGDDVTALSGYCTHQGCAVAVAGDELDCPCHGSRFDASTGEVIVGPATTPLPPVQIEVDGDVIRRVR